MQNSRQAPSVEGMNEFKKKTFGRPAAWEVAGLEWLRAAQGARIVEVLSNDSTGLTLERLTEVPPTRDAAVEFGAQLYITHKAGAPHYGVGPTGWEGNGYFGPNEDLQEILLQSYDSWGTMYAQARLLPMVENCAGLLGKEGVQILENVCSQLESGTYDEAAYPARIHGDLWSGNVLWTPDGVVLIDPSAQGGNALTDLAALSLFGCPQLEAIYAGYEQAAGTDLPARWRELLPLHQLSMLLMHVQVFGASYVRRTLAAAQQFV